MTYTGVLSAQKNEAPFLIEFVSHHIALGFDKIFIVTNPSTDGTNELADALATAGFIDHVRCDTPVGKRPQHHAFALAKSYFNIDALDWLIVLDADELLNIHVGSGSINELLQMSDQDCDLLSINMATFGNFPHEAWSREDSSTRFFYRFRPEIGWSYQGKTLIRNPRCFRALLPHGPIGFNLGRDLRIQFAGGLESALISAEMDKHYECLRNPGIRQNLFSLAQVNHYAVRTLDSFSTRSLRGDGASAETDAGIKKYSNKYFSAISRARFFDDSITRYRDRISDVRQKIYSADAIKICEEEVLSNYSNLISNLR